MGGFYGPVNIDPRARPRLKDRVQDDPTSREQPIINQPPDVAGTSIDAAVRGGVDVVNPPQPSLKERVIGGLEGAPGGGRAGLVGRVARGAISGMLGPTQRQDIEAERLGSQRIAGETGLEAQRERFALPEQQARIAQQEAGTEQSRLATKILQRRLDLMSGGAQSSLQDLTDDENAVLQSAYATGDPKVIEQAVSRIYNRRSVEGMVGPGTNVYDPNAPGGVSRQFMTRGGAPLPDATVRGAVVPGTLPRAQTSEQLVPTAGGGMAAVGRTSTVTPQIPGVPRAGGGGGVRDVGVTPAAGPTGAFERTQATDIEKYQTNYRDIQTLEREQRDILRNVQMRGDGTLTGPESMQFLADHMGLTVGRVKGMRTGKDLVMLHEKARSWPQDIEALYSRVVAGGVIPLSQAQQMLATTGIKRTEALRTLSEQARAAGMNVQINDVTGAIRVVPNAPR